MLEYRLFFGKSILGRVPLTDEEWTQFAADVVTPNLPEGFTALDADGQWQNPATVSGARKDVRVLSDRNRMTQRGEAWVRCATRCKS